MLTFLHIYSFSCCMVVVIRVLLRVKMSFRTAISKKQSRVLYCDFFGKIWLLTPCFIWWSICWFIFSTVKDALIVNAIFHNAFLTLKFTQPCLCFCVNLVQILLSQCSVFFILPQFSYNFQWVLLAPRWPQKILENLTFFLSEWSSSHESTEIGYCEYYC